MLSKMLNYFGKVEDVSKDTSEVADEDSETETDELRYYYGFADNSIIASNVKLYDFESVPEDDVIAFEGQVVVSTELHIPTDYVMDLSWICADSLTIILRTGVSCIILHEDMEYATVVFLDNCAMRSKFVGDSDPVQPICIEITRNALLAPN
jgi:hypothetical protein